jgi:eukaryotic-like serine/threonine-protein kinase
LPICMRDAHTIGFENAPRYAYAVAAVLLIAVAFSILQIAVVRPAVPAAEQAPLGMMLRLVVFTGAAIVLFLLRSTDATAALSVLALALSGVANAGPPGEPWEGVAGRALTGLSWIARAFAFPVIALAILYFPGRSSQLRRYPVLHAVPWIAALPMLVIGGGKALHLWGVEGLAGVTAWSAAHPVLYSASFAAALVVNLLALIEGVYRYRFNHDANERRRIRMAVYTSVPGVFAYAVHDGLPVMARLLSNPTPAFSGWMAATLNALVLLPAFGLVYAVGVERVLGPRTVLRRSLQYALATRTLRVLVFLPAIPLLITLIQDRDRRLSDLASTRAVLYLGLIGAITATLKYQDRARHWLDERFFRREYDARRILVSLAGRVRFETDPADLAALVVQQLDEALHPEMVAVMAAGVDDGWLTSVATTHRSAPPLQATGGLASMLRWSEQPLEIFIHDPRSQARRLPTAEQSWIEETGATLLVPVVGNEGVLIGAIVLGEKRSEEAYTDEDRELLGSIASQIALAFDVARLKRRTGPSDSQATSVVPVPLQPMLECPKCGRCEEAGTPACPADGSRMQPVASIPRVVDNKYRIEQVLGRGGMGAVYRARDVRLDRLVALKVVRPELLGDQEARQRFRREAQIVARLQHPGIVSVFDYGTFPNGGAYLVMELVKGEDLRRVLLREGRLDEDRALEILFAVCAAIEAAHRDGVLHRDLKPENILLPGGDVAAKVLDFGVAKVMRDDATGFHTGDHASLVTAAGVIVGTPAYMAPELLHGVPPDARSDVFSLGAIAFEMLTGELPFGRGSLADIVLAHARGIAPSLGPGHQSALDRAVRAALDPDPDRRPPTVRAFRELLASTRSSG